MNFILIFYWFIYKKNILQKGIQTVINKMLLYAISSKPLTRHWAKVSLYTYIFEGNTYKKFRRSLVVDAIIDIISENYE